MSAFIVDRYHIDCLVRAALACDYGVFTLYHEGRYHEFNNDSADILGTLLWAENLDSVYYRYPGTLTDPGSIPGPCDFQPIQVSTYTHSLMTPILEPVALLKAIDCYEYQSCEHPEWEGSLAHAVCAALRKRTIGNLPGYGEAQWELTRPARVTR